MQNLSDEDVAKLQKLAKESEGRGIRKAIADGVKFDKDWLARSGCADDEPLYKDPGEMP